MEAWKQTKYENYEASNTGYVRNKMTGKVLKSVCSFDRKRNMKLYPVVNIKGKTIPIHRIIAETFLFNGENKPAVNHLDGNKENNCVENLEWVTYSENTVHAYSCGLIKKTCQRQYIYNLDGILINKYDSKNELLESFSKSEILFTVPVTPQLQEKHYICLGECNNSLACIIAAAYKEAQKICCQYKEGKIITIDGKPYKWYGEK